MSSRFFENQPNEICSHLSEKASKGKFLKPEKLQNHSNEGKGQQKKKERGEEEEEEEEEEAEAEAAAAMVSLLVYIIATLEIVSGRKNCSTQKVRLAITLSKIRLDV